MLLGQLPDLPLNFGSPFWHHFFSFPCSYQNVNYRVCLLPESVKKATFSNLYFTFFFFLMRLHFICSVWNNQTAHFSSQLRSLQMAAQQCGASATPPHLVLSAHLPSVQSVPSSRSFVTGLNSIRGSIIPWGATPVTGLQLEFVLLITTLRVWQFRQFSVHLTIQLPSLYFAIFPVRVLRVLLVDSVIKPSTELVTSS